MLEVEALGTVDSRFFEETTRISAHEWCAAFRSLVSTVHSRLIVKPDITCGVQQPGESHD
jgi:hypothetical protein